MKDRLKFKGYYFITDRRLSRKGDVEDVKIATAAGVKIIQYREKDLPAKEFYTRALALKLLCRSGLFLINDRVDIALAVEADGVHIGSNDLPLPAVRRLLGKKRLIGVSVRSVAEARAAEADGADYLGVGPVFSTGTKTDAGPACGVELVSLVRKNVSLPLVAIGGITPANAASVIAAGADMVSAIRAVVAAENAAREIERFEELFV